MAHIPKYLFPRFYIKHTDGHYSLHHRLTHGYIESFTTEKEVAEEIEWYNAMEEKEFWEELLQGRFISIKKNSYESSTGKDEKEDWFRGAWSFATDKFYDKYPKLLVECEELPYPLINKIRQERYAIENANSKKLEEEKREAERIYQMDLKELRKEQKQSFKDEVISEGKIGSIMSIEKMKKQARKTKKKLTIKTPSAKNITIEDSDDLFA